MQEILTCERCSRSSPRISAYGELVDKVVEHALLATRDCGNGAWTAETLVICATVLYRPHEDNLDIGDDETYTDHGGGIAALALALYAVII